MGVYHGTNWPFQQKPELGLYQQKYCQLRLKGAKKMIQMKEYEHALFFKKKEKGP